MNSDDHQKFTEIILRAIQNDDPELLGKYVPEKIKSFMCLDLNGITNIPLLQDEPPLISIAVYFGAKKCATFLIETGSELDATDNIFLFIYLIEFIIIFFYGILIYILIENPSIFWHHRIKLMMFFIFFLIKILILTQLTMTF